MITIITYKSEIKRLLTRFHKQLDQYLTESVRCWVGYPSGSFEDVVRYSPELNIWKSHIDFNQVDKFWNGFGIGRPVQGKNHSLVGEINFPLEGIKRAIAGAFGIGENGKILVLHRGKIGGGKKGVGKSLFVDNFRGEFVYAIDNDRESRFCLVGELSSEYFPHQVASFIHEIRRVKNLLVAGTAPNFENLLNFIYTAEHSGVSVSERNEPVVINRTHGIVANALADELSGRGYQISNDQNRDLYIHNDNQITTLFEIKTSSSTQNLYSALGQLLLYSIPIRNPVQLIAVLPDRLATSVENRFTELGIIILYYKMENGVPRFNDLDSLLRALMLS